MSLQLFEGALYLSIKGKIDGLTPALSGGDGLTPALSGGEGVGLGGEMSDENFGLFEDAVTTSWDAPANMSDKALFLLRFKVLKEGKLSQMQSISSCITKADDSNRSVRLCVRGEKLPLLDS